MALYSLGFLILVSGPVAAETAIGPGVAGQIHALAYDPTDPEIIYAGGDNCGVYIEPITAITWERWNEGLADDNPRMTSYVDDLLVVPPGAPGIDPMAAGVYAATRGGIAFRARGKRIVGDPDDGSDIRSRLCRRRRRGDPVQLPGIRPGDQDALCRGRRRADHARIRPGGLSRSRRGRLHGVLALEEVHRRWMLRELVAGGPVRRPADRSADRVRRRSRR